MSAESSPCRFRIGVDENGLGPRLGPMVVTAILARVTAEGALVASRKPRGALAKRLGDSKQLLAHGDTALGEAWARALAVRFGRAAQTADELVEALSADDSSRLRAACPSRSIEEQCWGAASEPLAAPAALVGKVSGDLDRLAEKGVEPIAVRSVILCARRINQARGQGQNRFVLDLHTMERLVVELRALAGGEVAAVCGKVGGFGRYSDAFGPLGGRLHSVVEEGRARSTYRFPGLGDITFLRDGDGSDLCVAMASMVGKWIRESLMGKITSYYQRLAPTAPRASGYHDPVTAELVRVTRLVRRERAIPVDCFERRGEGDGVEST